MIRGNTRQQVWGSALATALASSVATIAGSFSSNFSTAPAGASLYGDTGTGEAGVIEDGILKLTKNVGSMQGGFIIDDLDGGNAITGFTATFKLLIGGGSGADGFSFNFGPDLPDGSMGEEGAGTGLTLAFDTYDNGGGEAPAIDLKKGGVIIASKKGVGGIFRNNQFNEVRVTVDNDGSLDLSVGGTVIFSNVIGAFAPSAGRFGFGARTGGSADNHWVDDMNITTRTDAPVNPIVIAATPQGGDVTPAAVINIQIEDRTTSVNVSTVKLKFDGADVAITPDKVGAVTTVTYDPPGLLAPGSTHTVDLAYSDNANPANAATLSYAFTVANYVGIPAAMKVTPVTSKRGFLFRIFANQANQVNSSAKSDAALSGQLLGTDGQPLPNLADYTNPGVALAAGTEPNPANAPVQFEIETVINMSPNAGSYGAFQPDDWTPGLPAFDGSSAGAAAEAITYIEVLAGATTMGVQSDDGFRVTTGRPSDAFEAIKIGEFDGGRGASETAFTFVAEEAGVYPFRLTWENGGGDANVEWYSFKADGTRVLVNDTANGGLRAYRETTTSMPPFIKAVTPDPVPRQANVAAKALGITLSDATTAVNDSSVKLTVDGKEVTPTKNRSGKLLTLSFGFSGTQIPTDKHTAELTYKDASGNFTRTQAWTFYNIKIVDGLPAPAVKEDFDSYPEDSQPTGWNAWNFTAHCADGRDIASQTSESYENWVLVSTGNIPSIDGGRPFNLNPGETYNGTAVQNGDPVGGTWPEWLMSGNVLYAESDSRCNTDALGRGYTGQTQFITSKAFNLSALTKGVVMTLSSIYEQNQDSIGSIEYSVDGGTTWLPVAYFLEPPDIKYKSDGTVDAVKTFTDANTDTSSWVDNGVSKGGKYGDCLGATITDALSLYVVPRVNDDQVEGKRVEIYRLDQATGKSDVRLRFGQLGTDSWYFAVDNIVFYDVAGAVTTPAQLSIQRQAAGVSVSWTGSGTLQEAATVNGPWTASGSQANPQTVSTTGAAKFLRVVAP